MDLTKGQQTCIKLSATSLSKVITGDENWIYGCDFIMDLTKGQQTCIKLSATSLSKVITGDKNWIYGYDPETSQWKSPNSLTPKKARQVKSKDNSKLIIFHVMGTVYKEFTLASQTVNSAYYCAVL
jgi:hypothetical protein